MANSPQNLGPYRLRPMGQYNASTRYRYLDVVLYNGSSYVNLNTDTIETPCFGITPVGMSNSEAYWTCLAQKGDTGLVETEELPILQLNGCVWDFEDTDKVIVSRDLRDRLEIQNVYNGCCGIIITDNPNLLLPVNSDYSIDFNYIDSLLANQYYMYTFVYGMTLSGTYKFMWNRTVFNKS